MKNKTYGIHTRLRAILDTVEEIDRNMRIDYLRDKYGITVMDAMIVWEYDFEDLVDRFGLEEAIEKVRTHYKKRQQQSYEERAVERIIQRGLGGRR